MRFASLVLAAASAVTLTGCSDLVSLNPFVTDKEAVTDPSLVGTWKAPDGALAIIQQADSAYDITYTADKDTAKFEGRLIKTGNADILDLVIESDDAFQVPAHLMARVWVQGSTLRWIFLDSKWLRGQAANLASQPSGTRTLLTAPGDKVRDFVLTYGANDQAYEGDPVVMTRQ